MVILMQKEILDHYLKYGMFTYPGLYEEYLKTLPNDIKELGELIRHQEMHRVQLRKAMGEDDNKIKREYPWYKPRCHDDMLLTTPAMLAELFRQDARGFTHDRAIKDMIIITCRYVSVLTCSILKAKKIPCRSRAGFTGYIEENRLTDHWINQYWSEAEKRWITFDLDEDDDSNIDDNLDLRDMYEGSFYFAANAWLDVRSGKANLNIFDHGGSLKGLNIVAWQLFYDFHALMNNELSYRFIPSYLDDDHEFYNLSVEELNDLDRLAELMLDPDANFDELRYLYYNDKRYRSINTPLVGDNNYVGVLDN